MVERILVVGPSDVEDISADVVRATDHVPEGEVPEEYIAAAVERKIAEYQGLGYTVRQAQKPTVGRFEDPADVNDFVDLGGL